MGDGGFSGGFAAIFIAGLVLIFAVWIVAGVSARRNWVKAKEAGFDPLTMRTDLAIRAMQSGALVRPTADRLADLDVLLAKGTITADEHAEARRAIIAEV